MTLRTMFSVTKSSTNTRSICLVSINSRIRRFCFCRFPTPPRTRRTQQHSPSARVPWRSEFRRASCPSSLGGNTIRHRRPVSVNPEEGVSVTEVRACQTVSFVLRHFTNGTEQVHVTPDMTTLGKVWLEGFPWYMSTVHVDC